MRELECCDYRTEITPETGNEKIFLAVTVHNINKQKTEEIFCKVETFKEEIKEILAR